jgi:hypothetical protein
LAATIPQSGKKRIKTVPFPRLSAADLTRLRQAGVLLRSPRDVRLCRLLVWYRREDPDCADVGEAFPASTISPGSLQELSLRYPDDCRNGRAKPAELWRTS